MVHEQLCVCVCVCVHVQVCRYVREFKHHIVNFAWYHFSHKARAGIGVWRGGTRTIYRKCINMYGERVGAINLFTINYAMACFYVHSSL